MSSTPYSVLGDHLRVLHSPTWHKISWSVDLPEEQESHLIKVRKLADLDACARGTALEEPVAEAVWAKIQEHSPSAALPLWRLSEDHYVLGAPYLFSLAKTLHEAGVEAKYIRTLGGWLLTDVPQGLHLGEVLGDTHPIVMSSGVTKVMGPRGHLEQVAAKAAAAGIHPVLENSSGRSYKPHQETSVRVLAHNGGGLLADQVGLGKGGSFVGGLLALGQSLEEDQRPYPCVVSVPKSLLMEISEEVRRWTVNAKVTVLKGRKSNPIDADSQFIVLNHDILSGRLPDILKVNPRAFIADEAHAFQTPTSARTKAAQELTNFIRKNAKKEDFRPYITLASGTPMAKGPRDLWSLLCILGIERAFSDYALEKLGTNTTRICTRARGWHVVKIWPQRAFELYFCGGWTDKFGSFFADGSTHSEELNQLLVENGMIRRRKSDVISPLPPLHEAITPIFPSGEAMADYERARTEFIDWAAEQVLNEPDRKNMTEAQAYRIVKSKMAGGGAGLMRLTAMRERLGVAKVDETVAWIHQFMKDHENDHPKDGLPGRRKLILFVHHREAQAALVNHPELEQYGMCTILSAVDQKDESIQEHKARFQNDPDTRLMVCSMAAREGHTLTAASDIAIMEIPFVPSWIIQMAGRCWARISEAYEPHFAHLHYLVVEGTEDARSIRRVKLRKARFDAIIDGEGDDESVDELSQLRADELMHILSIDAKSLGIAR